MPRDATPLAALPSRDLALVRALRAWGESTTGPGNLKPDRDRLLRWFRPQPRAQLEAARVAIGRTTPELAWQELRADQGEAQRFDPARVHPSWFVRLFTVESPAVQWVVAEAAPPPIRAILEQHCADRLRDLDPRDGLLRATNRANPVAQALAQTYWTERLVGDRPESPHDPPVVVALTRLPPVALVRLLQALGQAKQAFGLATAGPTPADEAKAHCRTRDRVRIAFFRRQIGRPDPRLVEASRSDFDAVSAQPRRRHCAVGLVTVARLLRQVDPHRARWAVQQLPYSVAQTLGSLGRLDPPHLALPRRALVAWEEWIMEAAWERLLREGRLGFRATPEANA